MPFAFFHFMTFHRWFNHYFVCIQRHTDTLLSRNFKPNCIHGADLPSPLALTKIPSSVTTFYPQDRFQTFIVSPVSGCTLPRLGSHLPFFLQICLNFLTFLTALSLFASTQYFVACCLYKLQAPTHCRCLRSVSNFSSFSWHSPLFLSSSAFHLALLHINTSEAL